MSEAFALNCLIIISHVKLIFFSLSIRIEPRFGVLNLGIALMRKLNKDRFTQHNSKIMTICYLSLRVADTLGEIFIGRGLEGRLADQKLCYSTVRWKRNLFSMNLGCDIHTSESCRVSLSLSRRVIVKLRRGDNLKIIAWMRWWLHIILPLSVRASDGDEKTSIHA